MGSFRVLGSEDVGPEWRGFHVPPHPHTDGARFSDPPPPRALLSPQLLTPVPGASGGLSVARPGGFQSFLSPETPSPAASSWESSVLLRCQACLILSRRAALAGAQGLTARSGKGGGSSSTRVHPWGGCGFRMRGCVSPLHPAGCRPRCSLPALPSGHSPPGVPAPGDGGSSCGLGGTQMTERLPGPSSLSPPFPPPRGCGGRCGGGSGGGNCCVNGIQGLGQALCCFYSREGGGGLCK